jgi:16S rRNA (uracil1498-N3)-methyltransferase
MRIPRIYLPAPLRVGTTVSLGGEAYNHVVRVLRFKPGAPLTLFNGEGGEFSAVLERIDGGEASARIDAYTDREAESPLRVLLVQGIAKRERMDYTLQKSVELGVAAIQPLFSERGVVNLQGERLTRRMKHWRGIVAGACEQSGRNRLPPMYSPQPLSRWLANFHAAGLKLLCNAHATRRISELTSPELPEITLLIGPEGGLSPREIAVAQSSGFTQVRLGPRVMRTETAGLAALAVLQTLWGDLG